MVHKYIYIARGFNGVVMLETTTCKVCDAIF